MTTPGLPPGKARLDLLAAEYTALKGEQTQRINTRDNLVYVAFLATALIAGAAIEQRSVLPLLAITPATAVIGWKYLMNDRLITAIRNHIAQRLRSDAADLTGGYRPFSWEIEHTGDRRHRQRRNFQTCADLATFVLPGGAAGLIYVALAGQFTNPLLVTGGAVVYLFDLLITIVLTAQFIIYAREGLTQPEGPAPADLPG